MPQGPQFTPKMQKVVGHYAQYGSRINAYRHGYDCSTMSSRTVHRKCHELFKHPIVAMIVAQMEDEAIKSAKVSSAWVLYKAKLLADFNINRFIVIDEESGDAFYDFYSATDDDWYCITEYTVENIVKTDESGARYPVEKVKLKTESRLRALELVGKHTEVQAFREVVELQGKVGITIAADEESL